MSKEKVLSAKQLAVIEDLFEGKKEQEILKKHNLSRKLYNKWLADEAFNRKLDRRAEWEYRKIAFNLARSARKAVSSLVKLAESEKGETSRKACVDLITIRANHLSGTNAMPGDNPAPPPESPPLTQETAGKLLAVLAEQQQKRPETQP
jgi:thymidylate synthase ThyX